MNKIAQRKKDFNKRIQELSKINKLFGGDYTVERVEHYWLFGLAQPKFDRFIITNGKFVIETTGFFRKYASHDKDFIIDQELKDFIKNAYMKGEIHKSLYFTFRII